MQGGRATGSIQTCATHFHVASVFKISSLLFGYYNYILSTSRSWQLRLASFTVVEQRLFTCAPCNNNQVLNFRFPVLLLGYIPQCL